MVTSSLHPSVSVVIPAYNDAHHLSACLDSVFAQQVAADMEVIVVDDGSTDDSRASVLAHPKAIYMAQTNEGPAAARNLALEKAQGTFVAFLDADDLWPASKLQHQLDLLLQHRDAGMCFGDCQQFGERVDSIGTLFEESRNGATSWGNGPFLPQAYDRLLTANFITTGSVVARRNMLLALGGFDVSLRLVEDLDLWLRVARKYPILWTPEVCLLRRRHPDNLSRDRQAMSLAYLEVLGRQKVVQARGEVMTDVDIAGLMAREYVDMADRALQKWHSRDALRWAWRSLKARPNLQGVWRLAQGASQWLIRGSPQR